MSRIVEAFNRLCESTNVLPKEILDFMNMSSNMDFSDQLRITKTAVDRFFKELKLIQSKEDSWEFLDSIYTDKRNFYKTYLDFAKKCKEMSSIEGITGYDRHDFVRTKIMELCRAVDYNFPYGWK